VAIAIHQDEGSRAGGTGTRAVQAIAAGVVTYNLAIGGNAVGQIHELFGTPGSDGFYSVAAIAGVTVTYSPAPANQAAPAGSGARLNVANTKQAAVAVTAFTTVAGVNFLQANTALFVTNGCRRGDRLAIAGGGQNQGGAYIRAVLSETLVAVDTVGGVAWAVGAITTETVAVRAGLHRVVTLDEAAIDWTEIRTLATLAQGAGVVGNPTLVETRASITARQLVLLHGLSRVVLGQSSGATATVFTCQDEAVMPAKPPATGTGILNNRIDAPSPSGLSSLEIGSRLGQTDDLSFGDGSYWQGVQTFGTDVSAGRLRVRVYGSMLDMGDGVHMAFGPTGHAIGLNYKGTFLGSGEISRSLHLSDPGIALLPNATDFLNSEDVLIGSAGVSGVLIGVNATLGGFLLSAATTAAIAPVLFLVSSGTVNVDNLRADIPITDLLEISGGAGPIGQKRYLFNPTFVALNASGTLSPVSGVTITIRDLLTGSVVFSGTTNVLGKLNAGAGVILVRQDLTGVGPGAVTDYAYRLSVQGAGFRLVDEPFFMVARALNAAMIPLISPPYEGEFGE
jgi:hypothetical protein